jgi:DNA-directed RNA polymerase specialized sigma24 family protein
MSLDQGEVAFLSAASGPEPDLKDIIDRSLQQLPPLQRSIILLRDYEGYNYKEIADILELNESQVKVYLFRGRQRIKDLIKTGSYSHLPRPFSPGERTLTADLFHCAIFSKNQKR